jgi:hypothetical protein
MSYSVLEEIDNITTFVKSCMRDPILAGFDILTSKHSDRSYVIAKRQDSFEVAYLYTTKLDSLNPHHRAIMSDAIHFGMNGTHLNVDIMNDMMVCKSEIN